MKFRNIFWGVVLIFAGVLFILQNLHIIHFDWQNLWRIWPVVLILWGVSILPAHNLIKLGLTLLILAATVFFMVDNTHEYDKSDWATDWLDEFEESEDMPIDQNFVIPYEDSSSVVILDMDLAAGAFYLNDITDDLMGFDKRGRALNYSYLVKRDDSITEIRIESESGKVVVKRDSKHTVDLSLNTYPVYEMNMDVGAAKLDFDLSPYKVGSLDLDGGAASFELRFGDAYPETHVNIDAGASSISLEIPESSGCDLKISSVLSGKTINGFNKVDHGHYRTDNFDASVNKIYIEVDAAVSSYTITRY